MACKRITVGITGKLAAECRIEAVLDPYNPSGATKFVNSSTSNTFRRENDANRCRINWVTCGSDREAEFCSVAEAHSRVKACVKIRSLCLEVPCRYGFGIREDRPDFVLLVDDGHGDDDVLEPFVEIKGDRCGDAEEKKSTTETCWVPGVKHFSDYGCCDFVAFSNDYPVEADFQQQGDTVRSLARRLNETVDAFVKSGGT